MKTTIFSILLISIVSCSKNEEDSALSSTDASAVAGMTQQISHLEQALNNLVNATDVTQRHHWDSVFHHYNSQFWHHHNQYHHDNNHPHNDHNHNWINYDPAIDHSSHYHHPYEGHANDSLVIVANNHHTSNEPHHDVNIHHLQHHNTIDSLHHLHQLHHH